MILGITVCISKIVRVLTLRIFVLLRDLVDPLLAQSSG